jgi:hypothetical protein
VTSKRKFVLLGVTILLVLVFVSLFGVIISTDKTTYHKGETVEITITSIGLFPIGFSDGMYGLSILNNDDDSNSVCCDAPNVITYLSFGESFVFQWDTSYSLLESGKYRINADYYSGPVIEILENKIE